jgi:hypothetical protein
MFRAFIGHLTSLENQEIYLLRASATKDFTKRMSSRTEVHLRAVNQWTTKPVLYSYL